MDNGAFEKLREVRGCLSSVATPDAAARRRYDDHRDDDRVLGLCVSPFEIDAVKLSNSKAMRRLFRKTQVVSLPTNAHTRNRGTHTLEVECLSTLVARILGLNASLCRAGALGHDQGHVGFGHAGEKFISEKTGKPFRHEVFGVVVAQKLERRGRGLNLTWQTLDVMRSHSRGSGELNAGQTSPEGNVVMFADKIAYLFADYNDMFKRDSMNGARMRVEDYEGLEEAVGWFGGTQRQRQYNCLAQLCLESAERGEVSFTTSEAAQRFAVALKAMYQAYRAINWSGVGSVIDSVYGVLERNLPDVDPALVYALLTEQDIEAIHAQALRSHLGMGDFLRAFSVVEIMPYLRGKDIDFANPDLDW